MLYVRLKITKMSGQPLSWNLTFSVLRQCDIYRDGGSWEAVFTDSKNRIIYLWLSRHPAWSEEGYSGARHQHLFVDSEVPDQSVRVGVPIWSGSEEELRIIGAFEQFIKNPEIDIPFAHRTPKSEYLKLAVRMLESIKARQVCKASSEEERVLAIPY